MYSQLTPRKARKRGDVSKTRKRQKEDVMSCYANGKASYLSGGLPRYLFSFDQLTYDAGGCVVPKTAG